MIGATDVEVSAGRPWMGLGRLAVFTGSTMTLRVRGIPASGDGVTISGVAVAVENTAAVVVSVSAADSDADGVWTATIPASHFAAPGSVAQGVTITASGTDETGAARTWVLGKGDLDVLDASGIPTPGETLALVKLRDALPESPEKGDLCEGANGWQIYTGEEWAVISPDLSNYATKADATLTAIFDSPEGATWSVAYPQGWTYGTVSVDPWDGSLWKMDLDSSGDTFGATDDINAASFSGTYEGLTVVATRTDTPAGNRLGLDSESNPNRNKLLASEAEAEALRTMLAGKANDADVVHTTGAETITGRKTFSGSGKLYVSDSHGDLSIMSRGFLWSLAGGGEPELLFPTKSGTFALTNDLPYALGAVTTISTASQDTSGSETIDYGSATMADRTGNVVAITTALDELRVTFPDSVDGKMRDFLLRVEVGTGSAAMTAPSLVAVAPSGETITLETEDGSAPTIADGTATSVGTTILSFTESCVAGKFLVMAKEVKEVS